MANFKAINEDKQNYNNFNITFEKYADSGNITVYEELYQSYFDFLCYIDIYCWILLIAFGIIFSIICILKFLKNYYFAAKWKYFAVAAIV